MSNRASKLLVALLFAGFVASSPLAQAQPMCSGNQDFAGPFGFVANRLSSVFESEEDDDGNVTWTPVVVTPPGSTGQFSNTPIGRLASGSFSASPFSVVGRIFADGGGTLFAASSVSSIGSYSVNADCTITLTIRDVESTTEEVADAPVTFEGVLQARGQAASLVQTSGAGQTQVEMMRPYLNSGCSNASLDGGYGFGGFGLQMFGVPDEDEQMALPGVTPFSIVGRGFANGNGAFAMDAAGNNSIPNGARHITGTYSVNQDCTGTATLSSDGGDTDVTVGFVLTPSSMSATPGQLSPGPPRAEMRFVLTGQNYAGSGTAR